MTIDQDSHEQYVEVSPDEQKKIESLIAAKKLPPTFQFKNKTIVTAEILGFTEQEIYRNRPPKFQTADDFFAWGRQQKWYQKAKKASALQAVAAKPSTSSQLGIL